MQWRGNVSLCDRLGDSKEEQLKRSTSLTWVHCKKGDKRFWKVVRFGLLFICLPVWCLLVFRVVSLFGWRGRERSLPSCLDYSIFLEDAFASWRSRFSGSLCFGHNNYLTVPLPILQYKWVPNSQGMFTNHWGDNLRWTGNPFGGGGEGERGGSDTPCHFMSQKLKCSQAPMDQYKS